MPTFFFRFSFFSLSILFIFLSILSVDTFNNSIFTSGLIDKFLHFFAFFALTTLGLLSKFKIKTLLMIALLFILGIFLEIIHFFHPYRVFELLDIVANTLGILAGLGLNFFTKKY
tara:strand:- start:2488 stop:2832 length:345 start_codon:yes stop_codon:yes gene_type:complete